MIINCGRAAILGEGVPGIYIHLIYVLTFGFFAVVVMINWEERIKVNLLQIDFHLGQGYSLFVYSNNVNNLRVNPKPIILGGTPYLGLHYYRLIQYKFRWWKQTICWSELIVNIFSWYKSITIELSKHVWFTVFSDLAISLYLEMN